MTIEEAVDIYVDKMSINELKDYVAEDLLYQYKFDIEASNEFIEEVKDYFK